MPGGISGRLRCGSVIGGGGGICQWRAVDRRGTLQRLVVCAQGNAQSVVFEIGKDAIRPLLSSLETRTGKTVVDQPDPTKTNKQIKK